MEANTESQHRTRHVKMELLRRDFAKMLCQKATDQPHIRPQNQAPSSKHSKVTQRLPKLQDTSRYIKQVLFSSFFKFPIFFNPFPFHFLSPQITSGGRCQLPICAAALGLRGGRRKSGCLQLRAAAVARTVSHRDTGALPVSVGERLAFHGAFLWKLCPQSFGWMKHDKT